MLPNLVNVWNFGDFFEKDKTKTCRQKRVYVF